LGLLFALSKSPDNLFPEEQKFNEEPWNCVSILKIGAKQLLSSVSASLADLISLPSINDLQSDYRLINYALGKEGASSVFHVTEIPNWHPLQQIFWNGTCDAGQLTPGGLSDSVKHGKDFASVYIGPESKTSFLSNITTKEVYFRTSPEERTFQVTGGLLEGMGYDSEKNGDFPVHTFPSNLDDIVPNYSCSHANDLRNQINSLQVSLFPSLFYPPL